MNSRTSDTGRSVSRTTALLGPRTSAVLGACAGAVTLHTLGADWVSTPIMGLPVGGWMAVAAWGAAHRASRTGVHVGERALSAGLAAQAWTRRVLRSLPGAAEQAMERAAAGAESVRTASDELSRTARARAEDLGRRVSPRAAMLVVGLDMPEDDAAAICAAVGDQPLSGVRLTFRRAVSGMVSDGPGDSAAVDALLRRGSDGGLHVFVHEPPGQVAGWDNWSSALPLGYAGVFPMRIDAAGARLGACDLRRAEIARLAGYIAVAGAVLGRTPGRVGGLANSLVRPTLPNFVEVEGMAMALLAESLMMIAPAGADRSSDICRASARVLTAWLCSGACHVPPVDRLSLMMSVTPFVDPEPEGLLRLGAVQISARLEEGAAGTLSAAVSRLRAAGATCGTDPLPFVLSEAELGGTDGLTLGRVGAGIALMYGTAPAESLAYLREELVEDLGRSGWLAARPEDLRVLESLIARMESAASAREGKGGPAAKRRARKAA